MTIAYGGPRCDAIVNDGHGSPTECGRVQPCELHDAPLAPTAQTVATQLEEKLRAQGIRVRVTIEGLSDADLTEWSTSLDDDA